MYSLLSASISYNQSYHRFGSPYRSPWVRSLLFLRRTFLPRTGSLTKCLSLIVLCTQQNWIIRQTGMTLP
jgi:hypothetical protein